MINPIALAIPFFFVMIGLELLVARWQGRQVYRFADAMTNLSCGISQQATAFAVKGASLGVYVLAFEHLRLTDLGQGPLVWVATFLAVDFIYYWWHRFTHEVNIGWATHVVHHQSEEYNLAVALRQSLTSAISSAPFYLPLAILGVPPLVLAVCVALNTLYQFWIHTETVRSLGPLEWVLNTPSHHRVHHAVNPRYLDRNYGGVLLVWDRLFGTFEAETEQPIYGTVKPLRSYNPLWANWAWFGVLLRDSFAASSPADALRVWVKPPGWHPEGLPPFPDPPLERPADQVKYDPPVGRAVQLYVLAWFPIVAAATAGMLLIEQTAPTSHLVALSALILTTTVVWGGLFERRSWAVPLEAVRVVGVIALAVVMLTR